MQNPKNFSDFIKEKKEPYNLSQRTKFSLEQQKFLGRIFHKFSERLQKTLGPLIQDIIELKLLEFKFCAYQTYIHSLPDPSCLIVFRIDPQNKGIMFFDFPLSFALVDRLMGGKGESIEEIRPFTEIELAILKKTFYQILESYQTSFSEIIELQIEILEFEFNPLAIHIASPSEIMVLANFEVQIARSRGNIEFCLPFKHLKEIIPKASFEEFLISKSDSSSQSVSPVFVKNIESAKIPVSIELGRVEVNFQDLLQIEAGDIIKLDQPIQSPLKIKINDRTKFLGRPGFKEGKMAVQISKVLSEEGEEFEE
ncbi:MAG: flagellar motor switch protein FliM [Armatimonadetes bacterium]|nr:flagellar motor switch protein FliM [Armatimonadota bacterium]